MWPFFLSGRSLSYLTVHSYLAVLSVSYQGHRIETLQNGNYESLASINAYNGSGVRLHVNDQGHHGCEWLRKNAMEKITTLPAEFN